MFFDPATFGFCTMPDGTAVPYVLAEGLPPWSLEASTAGAESSAALPPEDALHAAKSPQASAHDAPAPAEQIDELSAAGGSPPPEADPAQEQPDMGRMLLASGKRGSARLASASAAKCAAPTPRSPSADSESTLIGSTAGAGAVPVDAGRLAAAEPVSGMTDLADMSAAELSHVLAERADQACLPPGSPRLMEVLSEHRVLAERCSPDAPRTLRDAALHMQDDVFGAATRAVQRACMARWHVIACGEAMAAGAPAPLAPPPSLVASSASEVSTTDYVLVEAPGALRLGVVPSAPRGRRLPLSAAIGELPARASLTSSQDIDALERHIAGAQLLAFMPAFMHHLACGLRRAEYEGLPAERTAALLRRKFGSFSAGSISGCRRALQRLVAWLQANGLDGGAQPRVLDGPPWLDVSGGLLSLWGEDERAASRGGSQGGASMLACLKAGLAWGVAHMGLAGLEVASETFLSVAAPSSAVPMLWPRGPCAAAAATRGQERRQPAAARAA